MNKHKVAVYGTLRPKDDKGEYLEATHFILGYDMYNYYDRFPYITPSMDDDAMVMVNVMEVDDKGLEYLDRYESTDTGLYYRGQEELWSLDEGEPSPELVWVYVAGSIAPDHIPSGDWTKREKE